MSDAEVAEQVLSEHERTVLRHLKRRGIDSTLALYRQYRNRESLEAAVRRMAQKVNDARNRPFDDFEERDLADVLSDITGMSPGQVLAAGAGRMNGAGARSTPQPGLPPAPSKVYRIPVTPRVGVVPGVPAGEAMERMKPSIDALARNGVERAQPAIDRAAARASDSSTSDEAPEQPTPPPLADAPDLEREVIAARQIKAALDGLTPDEREKALHLSIGRRESAARLARYRMGVEAIELALPGGYPSLHELVRRVQADG